MKKKLFYLISFTLLIYFSIRVLSDVVIYDTTNEYQSNICQVHQHEMKKAYVGTSYGFMCENGNLEQFPNAKTSECMGCVIFPWPRHRIAKTYVCKTCNSVRQEYIDKQFQQSIQK